MEDVDKDRLDQWLDSALRLYGIAEPRVGLEGRILASLATTEDQVLAGSARIAPRWLWALGTTAAAVFLAATLWMGKGAVRHTRQIQASRHDAVVTAAPNVSLGTGAARSEDRQDISAHQAPTAHRRPTRPVGSQTSKISHERRLPQFPSSRPLSEQEQLLVSYVEHNPTEALLMAQEQEKHQEEMQAWWEERVPKGKDASSNQTER
jgi:hypothetical protein